MKDFKLRIENSSFAPTVLSLLDQQGYIITEEDRTAAHRSRWVLARANGKLEWSYWTKEFHDCTAPEMVITYKLEPKE